MILDAAWERPVKARPAAVRIVFGIRSKQDGTAIGTGIVAIIGDMQQASGKWTLGGLVEQHGFLLGAEIGIVLLHTLSVHAII